MLTPAVTPRLAASVLVLRDAPFEVLMLRRHANASFMPNAWVFPGGIAEASDHELAHGDTLNAMRLAGVRETFEETGVWLGAPLDGAAEKRRALLAGELTLGALVAEAPVELESLVWTSRWITPAGVPKRFDTYFFLAKAGRDVTASADESEVAGVVWVSPADALARHAAGEMQMVFPTLRTLESMVAFATADALIESRRGAVIEPIEPVLVNGKPTLVTP